MLKLKQFVAVTGRRTVKRDRRRERFVDKINQKIIFSIFFDSQVNSGSMVTRGGWEYVGSDGRLYKVTLVNILAKTMGIYHYWCFSRRNSLPTSWVTVQLGSTYIPPLSRLT